MDYKYVLKINGMMCGMCEAHINDVIRQNFRIKNVSSSFHKNQTIIYSEKEIDEQFLKDKIGATGYIVEEIVRTQVEKKKGFWAKIFHK